MRERLFKDPDNELVEYLTREYGIDYMRARRAARSMTFAEFAQRLDTVEQIVGETSSRILKYGKLVESMKNGDFQEYLELARRTAQQLNDKIPDYAEAFFSLDDLKEFVKPEQETLDVSPIAGRYRIFDPTDEKSRDYLSRLINDGALTVGIHEHWNTTQKGARGGSVLKQIAYQIKYAFKELKLWEPDVAVNHGQTTLSVGNVDREMLDEIAKKLYNRHASQ
ncbi:MAG TPA: hypothetical protein VJB66_04100 [Candidatus Nanoarchaeia archaeon]|nr:hypothetical protein [Candidatus Nanoarchaeia archaeon]